VAVRGSGPGFFGVVTRFHLRVYPAYDQILRSAYVFPRELRDEVLAWTYDAVPHISTSLEMSAKVAHTPGIERQTTTVTAAAFCAGGAGPEMLEPLEKAPFLRHALRRVERVPATLDDLYALSDTLTPQGNRYAVDGVWTGAPVRRCSTRAVTCWTGCPIVRASCCGCSGEARRRARTPAVHPGTALLLAQRRVARPRRRPGRRDLGP